MIRAVGLGVTAVAVAAAVLAAAIEFSPIRGAVTLAALGILVLAFCPGRKRVAEELFSDAEARLRARVDEVEVPVDVQFCGSWFVCLRSPLGPITLWPDSASPTSWRRLLVYARWPRSVSAADARRAGNGEN